MSRRARGRRRSKAKSSTKQQKAFWGEAEKLPEFTSTVQITRDASAVVRSLGRVPLTGSETIAEHYFQAVLDRSVMLGSALAAAGGMIAADELTEK